MAAKKKAAKKVTAKRGAAKSAPAKSAPAKKSAAKKSAAKKVLAVPAGYHTITPNLVFKDAGAAIDWYVKAFGAKELSRMPSPDGKSIWHAEIKIGDSILFLNDESPMGNSIAPSGPRTTTAGIQLYVKDVDAWAKRAADAGANVMMPVSDMFWGDRMGALVDPFGHTWMIATRVRNMTAKQMAEAGVEFARKMAEQAQQQAAQ
ncbi:Glyoxalase family protein [Minicystis rosea]|nr:Glyoxalase family protein [Minicystis rosea]